MSSSLYEVLPRIVPADVRSRISIRGLFPQSDFRNVSGHLTVEYVGADGLLENGLLPGLTMNAYTLNRPAYSPLAAEYDPGSGVLSFELFFRGEGEHSIRILGAEGTVLTVQHVFSLKEDLYSLRPLRGDMHLHSVYSLCSRDKASPEYIAAHNCSLGLDFISVSDHRRRDSSLLAVDFARKCGGTFRAYPGEEVHLHDLHHLHFLNFGGSFGISDFLLDHADELPELLKPYYEKVPACQDEYLRRLMASSSFLFDKIRESGGLSVFNHPHWKPNDRFFLPKPVLDYIVQDSRFDAIEIFGGGSTLPQIREANNLNAALHQELCIRSGRYLPALGNNDAHLCDNMGNYCSIVFAPSNTREEIISAIRSCRVVAMDRTPGEFPWCIGLLRFVKYTLFLLREFYPEHDRIRSEEGRLMMQILAGEDPVEPEEMQRINERMDSLSRKFWHPSMAS